MGVLDNDRALRAAIAALSVPLRRLALTVSSLPDEDRAGIIGKLYRDDQLRAFAELLIDLEIEPHARALVVGELRRLTL